MTISVSPNQSDIQLALRAFLLAVLPTVTEVVVGQTNRVPAPKGPNFIVMWPILRTRISTNIHSSSETEFLGFTIDDELIATQVLNGTIEVGQEVSSTQILADTEITEDVTGGGGAGAYKISRAQTDPGPNLFVGGKNEIMQPTIVTMQLDVHGPLSSDNVQIISTLFRDSYGVDTLHAINQDITPLYNSEPRQVPFINAEQQFENRWIIDVNLEVNQSVTIPQQFASVAEVDLINVEATYP